MRKVPAFCPNRSCRNHQAPEDSTWFIRSGTYPLKSGKRVQRYQCTCCAARFTERYFSLAYYLKKPPCFKRVLIHLCTCSGIRDIARDLGVSPSSVQVRVERLARQAIGLHAQLLPYIGWREDLAADGFESYCFSQYFPGHLTHLVGENSQYLYWMNYTILRRKGRMSAQQRQRRERLEQFYRPDPSALYFRFADIFRVVCRYARSRATICETTRQYQLLLHTDEHPVYRRVISTLSKVEGAELVRHVLTPSKKPRRRENKLFPVNYLDRQYRKIAADHVRETTRSAKNVNNLMMRMWIRVIYLNYIQSHRVQGAGTGTTHAELAGIPRQIIRRHLRTFFTRRKFLSRVIGDGCDRKTWARGYQSPMSLKGGHVPAYALQ